MKKIFKCFYITAFICVIAIYSVIAYATTQIEKEYYVSDINNLNITSCIPINYNTNSIKFKSVESNKNKKLSYNLELKVLKIFPLTNIKVNITEEKTVDVLGTPFGIKLYTNGVLVISTNNFNSNGNECCPAKDGGINAGDYLISINGVKVYSNNDVEKIVKSIGNNTLSIVFSRNGKKHTTYVIPKISDKDNNYHLGIWVRDSSAGIGTLTFYDNENKTVAGLGHGICDSDTAKLLTVSDGNIVSAEIVSVEKSTKSSSGELCGRFQNEQYTNIITNSNCGIYGISNNVYTKYKTLPIAHNAEVIKGDAQILATIDGTNPKLYNCQINEIKQGTQTKNLIIEITDNELISKTGGIVQGMSGSPIIQNGKLVGAVTHVFVDTPTKGYGIFAENMLNTAQSVLENYINKNAS